MKLAVTARMAWRSETHYDNTSDELLGHTVGYGENLLRNWDWMADAEETGEGVSCSTSWVRGELFRKIL